MKIGHVIKKVAACAVSASIFLGNAVVMAQDQEILAEDPIFYQLTEDGNLKNTYKAVESEGNRIYSFLGTVNELTPGPIRVATQITNRKTTEQKVQLMAALKDKETGVPVSLEMSQNDPIAPDSQQEISVDITVPEGGNYILETYIWDSVDGLKPLKEKTVLSQGPVNLDFAFCEPYDRSNPAINLTWEPCEDAVSYDIYVEDELAANVSECTYTLPLEPYTPYKIYVTGRRGDNTLTSKSNDVYLMTEDTEESQQARMEQWEDDRFGMMITWGGYAAFGGIYQGENVYGETVDYHSKGSGNGSYAEWIKFGAGIPDDTYKAYVEENFTAENYDPKEWVRIAKEAGMKYIILISKHHEGMTLFNTEAEGGWSAYDTAAKEKIDSLPEKDMVKQLIKEAADAGIRIGMYYSQAIDWAQPGSVGWNPQRVAKWTEPEKEKLRQDLKEAGFDDAAIDANMSSLMGNGTYEDVRKMTDEVIVPQVEELLNLRVTASDGKEYGIDTLWWDMGQKYYPEFNYKIMKKVYEMDPEKRILNNNRIHHTSQYTTMPFDFVTPEQSIPSAPEFPYWETCMTMNENWGYSSEDKNFKPASELIQKLVHIASMGGNFLLNVGPKADGTFPEESVELLSQVGEWMNANGDSIYKTEKNPFPADFAWGTATKKGEKLYLHISEWNGAGKLLVPGLLSTPVSAKLITGKDQTKDVSVEQAEDFEGIILSGDALKGDAPYAADSVIELTFADASFTVGDNTVKVPTIQNAINGNLTIKPSQAQIISTDPPYSDGLMVENNGTNFGRWNHADEYPEWKVQLTRPGTYTVALNHTSPYDGGLEIILKKDGAAVAKAGAPYTNTGTWVTYKEQTFGALTVAEPGEYTVELHRTGANPVNVQSIVWNDISGYDMPVVEQDTDTSILRLKAQDAMRSCADNEVGADTDTLYGLDAAGGTMLWKVQIDSMKNFSAVLRAASKDEPADITVSVRDEKNVLAQTTVSLTSDTWDLITLDFDNNLDLSGLDPGTYYIELKAENGGKINVSEVTLKDSQKLDINVGSVTFTPSSIQQQIQTNLPVTVQSMDEEIAQVEKVNDTAYLVKKAETAQNEAVTSILIQTVDSGQQAELPVTVLTEELNMPKTAAMQEIPQAYGRFVSTGNALLDQEILDAARGQGKGVYQLTIQYRVPFTQYPNDSTVSYDMYPDLHYAVGIDGERWITGTVPKSQEWTQAQAYIELDWDEDIQSLIFRPLDNLNEFTGSKPVEIAKLGLKKVGGSEIVKNGGFQESNLAEWMVSAGMSVSFENGEERIFVQNPDDQSIQLRVYDTTIHNVTTPDKSNDIFLEYEAETGKIGNWWDTNDTISWKIQVDKPISYIVKYTGTNAWAGEMAVTITDQKGETVKQFSYPLADHQGEWPLTTEKELGIAPLIQGEYTITVSHANSSSAAFALHRIDLEDVENSTWTETVQQQDGTLTAEAKNAQVFGVNVKNANWVIADWNNKNDTVVWKINLTDPKAFQVSLKGGNGNQANHVYFIIYDGKGNVIAQTQTFAVPAIEQWFDVFTDTLCTLDLSGAEPGSYYIEMHQTEGKGLNIQQLIMK